MTLGHLFSTKSIICPHSQCDKCIISAKYWNDGKTPHQQPRLLHDPSDIVFLVSAVYICDNGHKTLAHDPHILKLVPHPSVIPFVLLHQTGFTQAFVDLCSSLCYSGVNFNSLEDTIRKLRWENYMRKKTIYECLVRSLEVDSRDCNVLKEFNHFQSTVMAILPSDDTIGKCFLSNFLESENNYVSSLQSVNTGCSLSFDHTFKIASNIGYTRKDGKWVSQYDSAFFVMNSEGKIVSWQFTKGTSFKEIKTLLTSINLRAIKQGNTIQTVYIDNCCQWRRMLQDVFGEDVQVKLDLFHAVQRITRKIRKRHPFYSQCVNDLRLVFRQKGDYGVKRTQPTPEAAEILKNIEKFVQTWKSVDFNNKRVLNQDAILEVGKLKEHIVRGCLSGISVSGGTNSNEAFHRYTNSFFHKSRIGTMLAYALMMFICCNFNSRDRNKKKCIGFVVKEAKSGVSESNLSSEPMGILPDKHVFNDGEADGFLTDASASDVDVDTMRDILSMSVSQLTIANAIQKQSCTSSIPLKHIPFMESSIILTDWSISRHTKSQESLYEHQQRLQNILASWNFILEPVFGDGNCFFTAVALNLIHDLEKNKNIMDKLCIGHDQPIMSLVNKLRRLLVDEWLGPNRGEYSVVCDQTTYDAEAIKFLNNGYYASVLGDTMPLAMANALKCNIVVFRSTHGMPITYITPHDHGSPVQNVLFVAYTDHGPGHYDSVLYEGEANLDNTTAVASTADIKCRCGVNVKDETKHSCCNTMDRCSSCKCLAAKKSCSKLCGCKRCLNLYGNRIVLGKRKRKPHLWQKFDLTSKGHLLNKGQSLADGSWSLLESIVLIHILHHIEYEGTCADHDTHSEDRIQQMFNCISDYAHAFHCSIQLPSYAVLRKKSRGQIISKVRQLSKEIDLLTQL